MAKYTNFDIATFQRDLNDDFLDVSPGDEEMFWRLTPEEVDALYFSLRNPWIICEALTNNPRFYRTWQRLARNLRTLVTLPW